jgi:hypothetical protein
MREEKLEGVLDVRRRCSKLRAVLFALLVFPEGL